MGNRKRLALFSTLRSKILISLFMISLLIASFTAAFSYNFASEKVRNISMQLSEQNVASAGDAVMEYLNDLEALTNELMQSDSLKRFASATTAASGADSHMISAASTQIMGRPGSSASFDFVGIYLSNGYSYRTQDIVTLPFFDYQSCISFLSETDTALSSEAYISSHWTTLSASDGKVYLLYLRYIYEPITMNKLGVVVFGLNAEQISQVYSAYVSGGFLMKTDGMVIAKSSSKWFDDVYPEILKNLDRMDQRHSTLKSLTYLDNANNERILSYYSLWPIDSYLVIPFEFYESNFNQEIVDYGQSVLWMTGLVIAFSIVLAPLLARGLTHSITDLLDFTQKVEYGNTGLRYVPHSHDEINYLGTKINDMLDQIQLLAAQREDNLMANHLMEIQLMQQQINPHLLYNTLDSLLWVLQNERFDDASDLVSALSEFFKISLSRGRDIIELQNELSLIRHYLTIQRLARQQNITLNCLIDPELEHYPIFKLTLQPLVENAIIHGFTGYRDDGCITIRAFIESNTVMICVKDNGIGMTEDEVTNTNESIRKYPRDTSFNHFGLYNINRRIVQSYGESFGLSVRSEVSEYTEVMLKLPINPHDAEKG